MIFATFEWDYETIVEKSIHLRSLWLMKHHTRPLFVAVAAVKNQKSLLDHANLAIPREKVHFLSVVNCFELIQMYSDQQTDA